MRDRATISEPGDGTADGRVRLDKWLWAARFFKTRALAAEAIAGGKIAVNGDKPKRAKPVSIGDRLAIRLGPYEHRVTVRGLAERRGPAAAAQQLYEEEAESRAAREALAAQMKAVAPLFRYEKGKPSKKERRDYDRFRGK